MPRDRLWLSLLIVFHLVAITIAALPVPSEVPEVGEIRHPSGPWLTSQLTPAFDTLASGVQATEAQVYRAAAPLRVLTRPYIDAGLRQRWNMFANPGQTDVYMRVDYFVSVAPSSLPSQRVQELVFPAAREDRIRWRHQFRDKSIFTSIENYFVRVNATTDVHENTATPAEMVPVARYLGERFAQTLPAGRQLQRVEVWYGTAPIPPPGENLDPAVLASRLQLLEGYRSLEPRPIAPVRPVQVGASTTDADITWSLLYAGES